MRRAAVGFALIGFLLGSSSASAWNDKGHMAVAYIAYKGLTPQEQSRVFQLLSAHPDFKRLSTLAGPTTAPEYRLRVFLHAATWPDLIRGDHRFYDETDPHATPKTGPKSFPDMKVHKPWHYKDIGFTTDGTPVPEPDEVNAGTQIREFRARIGDPNVSRPHRAYYLSWLEHLVGDVHQPMHCVSRFSADLRFGDRGGNSVKVEPFAMPEAVGPFSSATNLHSFWDGVLGASTSLTAIKKLAGEAMKTTPTESVGDLDEAGWVRESFEHARLTAYTPLHTAPQDTLPTITETYFRDARALALARVHLAGHRLAAVIKAALK